MQWRLTKTARGWCIEYQSGIFSGWKMVNDARRFSFEPSLPKFFGDKKEAASEMAKLIERYS
ncbi:hypothetical protein [Enterococcus larvae]|uniref:hypothetical protein n=1 Tax=Enterococcus larvae TaxID=2794352 RepID=UPI003F36D8B1